MVETKPLLEFYKAVSKDELEPLGFEKKAFHPRRVVLVLDRMNDRIWVVKGKQSSNKAAYTAGLAATKLNARTGFKFKISTVEPNESADFVAKILKQYEEYKEGKPLPGSETERKAVVAKAIEKPNKESIPAPPIKVEKEPTPQKDEKPAREIPSFGITYIEEGEEGEEAQTTAIMRGGLPPLPILLLSLGYDILAKEFLLMIDKSKLPERAEMRKKLINAIDDLLNELY